MTLIYVYILLTLIVVGVLLASKSGKKLFKWLMVGAAIWIIFGLYCGASGIAFFVPGGVEFISGIMAIAVLYYGGNYLIKVIKNRQARIESWNGIKEHFKGNKGIYFLIIASLPIIFWEIINKADKMTILLMIAIVYWVYAIYFCRKIAGKLNYRKDVALGAAFFFAHIALPIYLFLLLKSQNGYAKNKGMVYFIVIIVAISILLLIKAPIWLIR